MKNLINFCKMWTKPPVITLILVVIIIATFFEQLGKIVTKSTEKIINFYKPIDQL